MAEWDKCDKAEEDGGGDEGQSGGAKLPDVNKAKLSSQPTLNMVEFPNR